MELTVRQNFSDELPPSFGDSCPMESLLVHTESGQFSAVVTWTVPVATDNSGIPPKVTSNFMDPPHRMAEGTHVVIYTATDMSGNKKLCSITIKVVGKWVSVIKKKVKTQLSATYSNMYSKRIIAT